MSGANNFIESSLCRSSKQSSADKLKASVETNRNGIAKRGKLSTEEITDLRKYVLRGCFSMESLGHHDEVWELTPFTLMFFASSTFTDTQRERTSLITKIVPKLSKKLENEGVSGVGILPMDMRFGVRDENTLDHQTWIACEKELKRCSRLSSGLFFLSLQSDK